MKVFSGIVIAIPALLLVCWGINFYKLTQCDFEPDYKCEVIHAAGIIPPVSLVTAWIGADADNAKQ